MRNIVLCCTLIVMIPEYLCQSGIPCYDNYGRAQRCLPPFKNVAYEKKMEATNTCGKKGPSQYCLQIDSGQRGNTLECSTCYDSVFELSHNSISMTDFNNNDNITWWQSETMLEDVQYPNTVNLTLHLGKQFEITYIRLRFKSNRPESMAIVKRTHEGGKYIPYQYFSTSCEDTYNLPSDETITKADETLAICTDEYSDMSGANVVFSTLEGRPGAFNFDENPILQEWVTATDIKIVLSRINTYGDEVFGNSKVLQSYYYAISDISVGGRCKCNGHASECFSRRTGFGLMERYTCICEHNTEGTNCEQCIPFYNDRPWSRATVDKANDCQACDCNGFADRCFFDDDLYKHTGHGGHCLECREDTAGPHCERCKDNYFRKSELERCESCYCDPTGNNTHLNCHLNIGSDPTALPILGNDNWANFQMNFSFPCDGLIKQVYYYRSVPTVPVYLGIWRKTLVGNLLLKHKIKLQSNTFGLNHKVFEPELEVKSGDFVGIHHTIGYDHNVISHDTNQDSRLYETLVVEIFDEDMKEGKELNISGRKTEMLNKAFAIQFKLQLDYSPISIFVNTGVIIGVVITVVVAVAITVIIITVIFLRKVKEEKPVVVELDDGMYLEIDAIDPYYQSTSRQIEVRENSGYLPPLRQPVSHHHISGAYDEISGSEQPGNRSTLLYDDVVQGNSSHTLLQSNHLDSKDSNRGSEPDVTQGINSKPLLQSNHQDYLSILNENVPEVEDEHIDESVSLKEESTQQENNNYEKTANVTTNHYYKGLY